MNGMKCMVQNNDLISRSALIKAFEGLFDATIRKDPREQYTLDHILAVINDAEAVQLPNDKLIKVTYKLTYDASWLDNADSFMCSRCHYECSNPNALPEGAMICPRCYAIMDTKPEKEADL